MRQVILSRVTPGSGAAALARAGAPVTKANPSRLFAAALLASLSLAAGCGGDREAGAETAEDLACARKPARNFETGAVVEIEDRTPPCGIEFRKTGVRLEAVADGSRPDPGRTVVMDGRGLFYTTGASGWSSVISVWDPEGKYLASFGGEGDGPGEFRGVNTLFVDGEDNLHVVDFAAWTVFSPDHELLRRIPRKLPVFLHPDFGAVLDDGTILWSYRYVNPGGQAYFLRVAEPDGAPLRAWAPATGSGVPWNDGPVNLPAVYRPVSYVGGETFWAGPPTDDPKKWDYVLEEWGTDGDLKRAVRREAPWYEWRGETLSPAVNWLRAHDDLLFVYVPRPTKEYAERFEELQGRGASEGEQLEWAAMAEVVLEIIDLRSGELLASAVRPLRTSPGEEDSNMPTAMFRKGFLGYRYEEGPDGLPFVEVVRLELVGEG